MLSATFPDAELEADNGFYRDRLDERLRLICRRALDVDRAEESEVVGPQ